MSDDERQPPDPEDAELEREVRSRRRFSLAEAIGRAAGELMKGASPVTRRRQAELEIDHYLEGHLADPEGALTIVLERRVRDSEELLRQRFERPLEALAAICEHLLASPERLRRFVHQVDAEWGRMYSERPYFESGEAPPRPGDPYTVESVRAALGALVEGLRGDGSS